MKESWKGEVDICSNTQCLTQLRRQGSQDPSALAELSFAFGKVCFSNTWSKPKQTCQIVLFLPGWVVRETALPEADHKTVPGHISHGRQLPQNGKSGVGRHSQKLPRSKEELRLSLQSEILEEEKHVCNKHLYFYSKITTSSKSFLFIENSPLLGDPQHLKKLGTQ